MVGEQLLVVEDDEMIAASLARALTAQGYEVVWDEHWFGSTKTLDVHVASLRRTLAAASDDGEPITTLRGVGYRYELG